MSFCKKFAASVCITSLTIFAFNNIAQGKRFTPPAPPQISPVISTTYSSDKDRNNIEDRLEAKAFKLVSKQGAAATPQEANEASSQLQETVDVELVFKKPITQKQIDDFEALGGQISYVYKNISYGWNGRIALKDIKNLPASMGTDMVLVQEQKPVILHLDVATRTGRVRPVWAPGFASSPTGFDGASDITIAILDTGIDATHSDLSGRQVYWHDFSDDGDESPIDIIQHGSHVAGIALGTGAASGSGTGTLYFTDTGNLDGVPFGYGYTFPVGIPASTSVTFSSTARWIGGDSTYLLQLYRTKGLSGDWTEISDYAYGPSPLTENNTFTASSSRAYTSVLVSNETTTQDFVVTNSITNYPGVGDGFNKLRGVAPQCRWASAKVFNNGGIGNGLWVSAAIDDLVSVRIADNIKVMNLSIGLDGNPGIDATVRQKVNTAVNNGIVVVVSAGNDGLESTAPEREIDDPARAAMVLTVAATTDENKLTDYSSHGFSSPGSIPGQEEDYKPDISAPGGSYYQTHILSVDSGSADGLAFADQRSNDYCSKTGTSMASPFAAGAAALVIDAMEQQGVAWDFSSNQHSRYVKMILCATASETNANREDNNYNPTLQRASNGPSDYPAGKDSYEGYGILNPDAAIEAVSLYYEQGSSANETFGSGVYDKRVWARKVELKQGLSFQPTLTVPAGCDFDLYLYSITPSSYGTPVILASATHSGNTTESLNYTAPANTDALLVVKRVSGSGTFSLSSPPAAKGLAVTATTGGTVTTPGIGTFYYTGGTNANITALVTDPTFCFVNWSGTAVTAGKVVDPNALSTTVLMDDDYTVQANFSRDQTIIASAGANGSVSPSGTFIKKYNESVLFTATPDSGYEVAAWLLDGDVVQAGSSLYLLKNITDDHTVDVLFRPEENSLAFPGAEGAGCYAKGGRGSEVYEVTNLTNDANVGSGSIVDAVSEPNRTIVFRVSGTIELGDVILKPKSYTTIAGQTAPGDGICIKGRIHIENVSNVIIRYLRVRVDEGAANSEGDAIDIDGSTKIIIDHVTASYARDEGISCREDTDNISVQWCIISESLNDEGHSYGSLVRGQYGQQKTYHHNLYAHNKGRNPRPGNYVKITDEPNDPNGLHFDFRNNVIYNWMGSTAGYNDDSGSSLSISRYNFIGNAYVRGLDSTGDIAFREKSKYSYGYFADNSLDGVVPSDPWVLINLSDMTTDEKNAYKARSYLIPMEPVTTTSPARAKIDVLTNAGASFPKRDIVDTRIVNDVLNITGHIIDTIDDQPEGGWPTLDSLPPPTDTDHDGMPDEWENLNDLDLNNPDDRNYYDLKTNYTNLEVYLNSLMGSPPEVTWVQDYSGNNNDWDCPEDIALDSTGNVYVTGYARRVNTNYDFVTIKYSPDGSIAWTKPYNRYYSYSDYAMAIAVDSNSNIIVAGYSYDPTSSYDGIIIKYNSAGTQLWAKSYNHSGISSERLYDTAVDANGNIYAVGRTDNDGLVVKYEPDGTFAWAQTYNGLANGKDILYQLAIDGTGNVYACGESAGLGTGQDCLTVKYSPGSTLLWAIPYNNTAANGWDLLEAIALDSAGNVCVTGAVETPTDSNYVTIKYDPNGNELWKAFYTDTATGWDEAYAIAVDLDDNVIVTGYSEGATSADTATVKYNGQIGTQVWAARYNGSDDLTDYAQAITTDHFGSVYIHGTSAETGSSTDYLTIRYDANGTQLWKMNYNGFGWFKDTGTAMAFNDGIVYVTGYSTGTVGNYDYATIRYTQHGYCTSLGDLNGDCWVDLLDYALFADSFVASQDDYLMLENITDNWLDCSMLISDDCP